MRLLLVLLIITSYCSYGQQLKQTKKADFTWGEEEKLKRGVNYNEVIFSDKKGVFIHKIVNPNAKRLYTYYGKNDHFIEIRNSKMEIVSDEKIDFEYHKNKLIYEGLFSFGENFIALGRNTDKKAKVNSLFYKVISRSNLSNQSNWESLGDITFEKKRRTGSFDYTMSADSSKLLIYYSQPFAGKDSPEKFGIKVFDLDMKLLWNKDIELKYNESLFSVNTFRVDNDGNAYVLGKELQETGEKKLRDRYNSLYHILQYSKDGGYEDFEISLDERPIADITIAINQVGDLVCVGFYSENTEYETGIKGTFYHVIDRDTKKVKATNFKELDEDFITEGWTDREISKAKKKEAKKGRSIEAYSYDLKNLIVDQNSGATLLAEQYYVRVTTTTTTDANGRTTTTTTYHYYYNDIFIIKISPGGDIDWASKIDKYQHSVNDHGYRSSYTLHVGEDLNIIYNMKAKDHYEKAEYKAMSKKERKSYLTIIATVDQNGEVTKELLINNSAEEVYVVPKLCSQIAPNKTFVYTNKGRKVRLGILEFN